MTPKNNSWDESTIAIVGRAGSFPGAATVEDFWINLEQGVESISFYSQSELRSKGVDEQILSNPRFVNASAAMVDIECFDAGFFGYSAREAELMDPQQRVFLECAWRALEDAGYDTQTYPGLIGVFAGASMNTYVDHLARHPKLVERIGAFQTMLGNEKDFLSLRVSYKLGLKGPSLTIQTGCSTSLVSVHLACQSLLSHECDMALAGGVSVRADQGRGYVYEEGGIASPDGHCRAFDRAARGTIFGSGVGIVVVKRLADALRDGDTIHALIRSTAVNNDGGGKIGFTAPSIQGQAKVIIDALAMADIDPKTIGYVEAHGTGTELGDPIEIQALTEAYRTFTEAVGYCAIGSVKTNVGHLDSASGITGLIKVVEALKRGIMPASLNFNAPNPKIPFNQTPFFVNSHTRPWSKQDDSPLRAAVSSFGVGGTNAHAILEEAPQQRPVDVHKTRPFNLFVLSTKTEEALELATNNLTEHLDKETDQHLADVAYTLQMGRQPMSFRRAVVASERSELRRLLADRRSSRVFSGSVETKPAIVFMFPGQGTQYVNMAHGLYKDEPIFQDAVDRCAKILLPYLETDLRRILFTSDTNIESTTLLLTETRFTQVALFVIEYALAVLLMSLGVRPNALIGHSIGEYVAACLAGVFTLEDALKLVARRGQLVQSAPHGAMLAVALPESVAAAYCENGLSIAAVNGPSTVVLSGPTDAVEKVKITLESKEISCRILRTSHAFHSAMLDPVLDAFEFEVASCTLEPPRIPLISNLTGNWVSGDEIASTTYWRRHLREPVKFFEGLSHLVSDQTIFLEVGPGHTLSTVVRELQISQARIIQTLPSAVEDSTLATRRFLEGIGRLWTQGAVIEWSALYREDEGRLRVPLPTYPFARDRHWIDSSVEKVGAKENSSLPEKNPNMDAWFYRPVWRQAFPPQSPSLLTSEDIIMVFCNDTPFERMLVNRLREQVKLVVVVKADFKGALHTYEYAIDPKNPAEYTRMFELMRSQNMLPTKIVHMWQMRTEKERLREEFERSQAMGFYSLLYIAQAIGDQSINHEARIYVVTNNSQAVIGTDLSHPEANTVIGPVLVIPQEYPHISCIQIDMDFASDRNFDSQDSLLIRELGLAGTERLVAIRGSHRFIRTWDPYPIVELQEDSRLLKRRGTYLITGGLGGIGYALAHHLAERYGAGLALVGRTKLPPREHWTKILGDETSDAGLRSKITKILTLEDLGVDVLHVSADVSDMEQMMSALHTIDAHFGGIDGVFHLAGTPGVGVIQRKNQDQVEEVFRPKVNGTLVLAELFGRRPLDFLVLFSSAAAFLGGMGQVDYCGANAFLGNIAQHLALASHKRVLTIDWGQWQFDDWEHRVNRGRDWAQHSREIRDAVGMSFSEGLEALERALDSGIQYCAITPLNLNALTSGELDSPLPSAERQSEQGNVPAEGSLRTIESRLAELWRDLFGCIQVGRHDDFFELGGHSLLALRLLSRVAEEFGVSLTLHQLFEGPTVGEMANLVASELGVLPDEEALWPLLEYVESISDDQLNSELENLRGQKNE